MSNELRLIKAFIEAVGYEVEALPRQRGQGQYDYRVTKRKSHQTTITLPQKNEELTAFAIQHGFRQPGRGETWPEYRRKLAEELARRGQNHV